MVRLILNVAAPSKVFHLAVAAEGAVAAVVVLVVDDDAAFVEGRKLDHHWAKHHAQLNWSDVARKDPLLPIWQKPNVPNTYERLIEVGANGEEVSWNAMYRLDEWLYSKNASLRKGFREPIPHVDEHKDYSHLNRESKMKWEWTMEVGRVTNWKYMESNKKTKRMLRLWWGTGWLSYQLN